MLRYTVKIRQSCANFKSACDSKSHWRTPSDEGVVSVPVIVTWHSNRVTRSGSVLTERGISLPACTGSGDSSAEATVPDRRLSTQLPIRNQLAVSRWSKCHPCIINILRSIVLRSCCQAGPPAQWLTVAFNVQAVSTGPF